MQGTCIYTVAEMYILNGTVVAQRNEGRRMEYLCVYNCGVRGIGGKGADGLSESVVMQTQVNMSTEYQYMRVIVLIHKLIFFSSSSIFSA